MCMYVTGAKQADAFIGIEKKRQIKYMGMFI